MAQRMVAIIFISAEHNRTRAQTVKLNRVKDVGLTAIPSTVKEDAYYLSMRNNMKLLAKRYHYIDISNCNRTLSFRCSQ